jgi:hypothetical protein
MGWTTKDTLKSINSEINSTQQPPQQKQARNRAQQPTSCCERCSCECLKKVESTILRSPTLPQHIGRGRENEEPVARKSPKSLPHYALPQHCNRQERLEPLQQQQQHQQSSRAPIGKQTVKKQSKTNLLSGGVELVPLLAKRRDERPISLSTTDITKYKINQSR